MWDKTIVDRRAGLSHWGDRCYQTTRRGIKVYAYANNHNAGFVPATVAMFWEHWEKRQEKA